MRRAGGIDAIEETVPVVTRRGRRAAEVTRPWRRRRLALMSVAAFGLLGAVLSADAAPAQAGTFSALRGESLEPYDPDQPFTPVTDVTFTGTGIEANDVTVTPEVRSVLAADANARLRPGAGCTAVSERSVRCPMANYFRIVLRGGGGDDRLVLLRGARPTGTLQDVLLDGGEGTDRVESQARASEDETILAGGNGDDVVVGGGQAEELAGGPGRDVLRGGGGSDALDGEAVSSLSRDNDFNTAEPVPIDGPGEADVLDGGAGLDTVRYDARTAPIAVDLADPAGDGALGEGDQLVAVEGVVGGWAADVLRGDAGPNYLSDGDFFVGNRGNGSDDLLDGRGGDDRLKGSMGHDLLIGADGNDFIVHDYSFHQSQRLVGGAGNDTLEAGTAADVLDAGAGDDELRDTGRRTSCGAGVDVVRPIRPRTGTVGAPSGCERLLLGLAETNVQSPRRAPDVQLDVASARIDRNGLSVVLRLARSPLQLKAAFGPAAAPIAKGRVSLLGRSARRVRFPLTRAGRRAVAQGRIPKTVILHSSGANTEGLALAIPLNRRLTRPHRSARVQVTPQT